MVLNITQALTIEYAQNFEETCSRLVKQDKPKISYSKPMPDQNTFQLRVVPCCMLFSYLINTL